MVMEGVMEGNMEGEIEGDMKGVIEGDMLEVIEGVIEGNIEGVMKGDTEGGGYGGAHRRGHERGYEGVYGEGLFYSDFKNISFIMFFSNMVDYPAVLLLSTWILLCRAVRVVHSKSLSLFEFLYLSHPSYLRVVGGL